jgi:uncharacterized alkaline shock family protein YloU
MATVGTDNSRAELQATRPADVLLNGKDGVKDGVKDGTTTISDQVVAKIAGIAAREVEGVHELTATGLTGALSGMANKVSGNDQVDYGVKVQVGQQETIVNLGMVVDYGASIPRVAQAVRRSVSEQLLSMTGLKAREINIAVTDIAFAEQAKTAHELQ